MMQRILDLGPDVIGRYDTASLEMVCASGSALPGELALRWMDTFGDNVYNLYGSTEVGWGAIATPDDLRSVLAPCAGAGCTVEKAEHLVAKATGTYSLFKVGEG